MPKRSAWWMMRRVGARNIEPAFDDGGGKQHIIAFIVKGAHPFLDHAGRHLAMRGDVLDFGYGLAQKFLDIGQIGNARNHEEALPRRDNAHVAGPRAKPPDPRASHKFRTARRSTGGVCMIESSRKPGHRHLQRARNRRGGEREHVNIGLERFQPFLMCNTKSLLFINDYKAKPLKVKGLC